MEPATSTPTTEITPLLGAIDDPGDISASAAARTYAIQANPYIWRDAVGAHVRKWRVLYLTCLCAFLADCPEFMGEASRLRMLELGLCREYFSVTNPSLIGGDGGIAEQLCKIPEVQGGLARMRGYLALLEYLPGLLLAIPYGILADMRGRKLVMALSLTGLILKDLWFWIVLYFYESLPLRLVYSAPAFVVIGGGSTVFSATSLAVLAAAIPEDKRTQSFLLCTVTILVSELVSPPIGFLLLQNLGPQTTFIIATPLLLFAFIPIALFPAEKRHRSSTGGTSSRILADSGDTDEDPKLFENRLKKRFHGMLRFVRQDVVPFIIKKPLLLGISSLAVQKFARPMLGLLLQYMSVRFGWSLGEGAFLISIQAAAQMVVFLLIIPQIYGWLLKRQPDARAANLVLAKICVMILMLGSLCMALAPYAPAFIFAVIIYTCGTGFTPALRSFLTSLLPKDRITLLYTTMALFEGLASLAASPLLGLTFSAGIGMGGMAVALPFYVAAGVYALAAFGVWMIHPEPRLESSHHNHSNSE